MEKRLLGRTGHESTVVTLGAAGLGRIAQEEADKAIQLAMEHGVNHIDVAPSYGEAMEGLAPWMPRIRDKVFLGAKTGMRTRDEAWEDVRSCMRRLGVESFDLFQLHAVINLERLDEVTQPGGALETLVEMREQGLTRWIGVTGHGPDVPRTHLEALRRFDFDTIMFPVNASIFRNADYRRDASELLTVAKSRNLGIQAIKMLARGGWGDRQHDCQTWYDPHREPNEIDQVLRWLFSQPIHTAPSTGEPKLLAKLLSAAERFQPLSVKEQEAVVAAQRPPLPEPLLGILPAA